MKIQQNLAIRFLIALSSMMLYALIFLMLYPYAGPASAMLNFVVALIFGWLLGPSGGLMFGLIVLPVNLLLFNWVGASGSGLFSHLVGAIGTLLLGVGVGWIRNLNRQVRKQSEALQQKHHLLQEEIERRAQAEAALHQSNIELRERNKELDAFAHTVAHDLKNPLGIITTYGELLGEKGSTMRPDELDLIAKEIQKSGRKTVSIIEELLLLASIRKEAVTLRPLNMAEIVEAAKGRINLMSREYQAEIISPQTWPQGQGYGPWVEEVWVNYMSNGLKYGGQPPHLELGATLQENGMIRYWVRDNGSGLTPEAQALLFTEFTRLDNIRAKGHGLGLSIVRHIVEKLGGQVGVESNNAPGGGSTFYFTLAAG